MDRIGSRFAILRLSAAAALAAAAPPPAGFPIREAQWLDPAQRVSALSSQPDECVRVSRNADERQSFEIGRAAFRAPLLLGGQAARSGLSCASCHSNGRRNPAFHFPGLSGEPGTADVTSSLMSSHRGNGVFDPRPIPDLAVPVKISRARADPALEAFIRELIVEEFDGAVPPPQVLRGLGAYVRAVGRPGCDLTARVPLRVNAVANDAARAVAASSRAWRSGDASTARLLLASARSALGLINERFAGSRLANDRLALRRADLALLAVEQAMDRNSGNVANLLAAWRAQMPRWTVPIERDEAQSMFAIARLEQGPTPILRPPPARGAGSPHR